MDRKNKPQVGTRVSVRYGGRIQTGVVEEVGNSTALVRLDAETNPFGDAVRQRFAFAGLTLVAEPKTFVVSVNLSVTATSLDDFEGWDAVLGSALASMPNVEEVNVLDVFPQWEEGE